MRNRKPPQATPRLHSLIWLQSLLCAAVALLATPTALLLGVLLGPAFVAVALDRAPGRPRARSIALCNTAAVIESLRTLWGTSHTMAVASAILGDPRVVATAWAAAGAGWLLAELMPIAARAALEALTVARVSRLRASRASLLEAWGLEPRPDDQ